MTKPKTTSWRAEPMIQYLLFSVLVFATPFVVVSKFLQGAVNTISHFKFPLFGLQLPIVGTTAIVFLIILAIWQRHHFNPRRIYTLVVVVIMIAFSHRLQDLYGGMAIYDLQKNWHYVAYAAYVFFFFRAFHRRGMPLPKMILFTFITALIISLGDEYFQLKMSNRVFDISDQAKDAWGAMMGLILILFFTETYGTIDLKSSNLWHKRLSHYFQDPLSTLIICGIFSFVMLIISPLLTDPDHLLLFSGLASSAFIILFIIWHFLQFKIFRYAFIVLVVLKIITFSTIIFTSKQPITHNSYGWTHFRGIPIPIFDVLIYPNGLPRLVDKKHNFNKQDQLFLRQQKASILLIASGHKGQGGKGFPELNGTFFLFNEWTNKGMQVIILPTPEACDVYNRLISEGKKVLFVIHSTC